MKITQTDKPNTTQVSDTDGKDDDSNNEDEIEQNIEQIERMEQEPTWRISKQDIQQIYHTTHTYASCIKQPAAWLF